MAEVKSRLEAKKEKGQTRLETSSMLAFLMYFNIFFIFNNSFGIKTAITALGQIIAQDYHYRGHRK